jgi:hypothetical protein
MERRHYATSVGDGRRTQIHRNKTSIAHFSRSLFGNSVHHFFNRLRMLYWSAFNWISEGCDMIGSSHHLRLKRPTPCVYARVPLYIKLNPRPLLALATSASFRGSLRFRPKNMAHHIFRLETELQNIPEAAPKASPNFSVSGKLAGPRSLIRLHERRL